MAPKKKGNTKKPAWVTGNPHPRPPPPPKQDGGRSSDNNTMATSSYPAPQILQSTSHSNRAAAQGSTLDATAADFQPTQSRYRLRQRTAEQIHPYSLGVPGTLAESIEPRDSLSVPTVSKSQIRRAHPRRDTSLRDSRERSVTPLPEPKVDEVYLKRANEIPQMLPSPRKLLVVLDLNGTLIVRSPGVAKRGRRRPGVDRLLEYIFENHVVMVSTSTRLVNAEQLIADLLTPEQRQKLVTIRARETFGLTKEQYNNKVQIYKNLEDIWLDHKVQDSARGLELPWSQINTVLVDDTMLKAKAQPYSLIQVTEFERGGPQPGQKWFRRWEQDQMAIMQSVEDKLEILKWQHNVTCMIRKWHAGETIAPGVVDETVDQATKPPAGKYRTAQPPGEEDYLTPQSLTSDLDSIGEEDHRGPDASQNRIPSSDPITEEVFQELLGLRIVNGKVLEGRRTPEADERSNTPPSV